MKKQILIPVCSLLVIVGIVWLVQAMTINLTPQELKELQGSSLGSADEIVDPTSIASGGTTADPNITYISDQTDDFAVGGKTSSAPLYFDSSAGDLTVTGGGSFNSVTTTDTLYVGGNATTTGDSVLATTTLTMNSPIELSTDIITADDPYLLNLKYRNDLDESAKATIAFGSSTSTKAWISTHDYLNASTYHGHISIETKEETTDQMQSRFTIEHSCDTCDVSLVSGSNLVIQSGNLTVGGDATWGENNDFFHIGVFDMYPENQSTLALRLATTTGDTSLALSVLGSSELYINEDLIVSGSATSTDQLSVNGSATTNATLKLFAPDQYDQVIEFYRSDATPIILGDITYDESAVDLYVTNSITGDNSDIVFETGTGGEALRLKGSGVHAFTGDLTVSGNATTTGHVVFQGLTASDGTPSSICQNATSKEITVNAALTCTVSARDQKTGIESLDFSATDLIKKLNPVSFFYIDNLDRNRMGFIADEVQAVDYRLGDAYDENGNARSIDLPALISLNTKAIQELEARISVLESENIFLRKNQCVR